MIHPDLYNLSTLLKSIIQQRCAQRRALRVIAEIFRKIRGAGIQSQSLDKSYESPESLKESDAKVTYIFGADAHRCLDFSLRLWEHNLRALLWAGLDQQARSRVRFFQF